MKINQALAHTLLVISVALLAIGSSAAANNHPINKSNVLELNDSTVNNTLTKYPFFILNCYEKGCEPCQRLNASIHELSAELAGQATFGMIDVGKYATTAKRYNITSYPTLLIFENGSIAATSVGFGSKAGIADILRRLKPGLNTANITSVQATIVKAQIKAQKNCSSIKKQDQPILQAFVVSYCPFGLQMQRVLSGIIGKIPSLSKNIKIRYIVEKAGNSMSSMHGQQEFDENLRQICIREEQPDKYWKYVSCFTESGNSSECINSSGVNETALDGCLANSSRVLKYAREDFNFTQRFNITGSPTLLMNGEIVRESDFGGRTEQAVKNMLCCGFGSKPDYCSMNLSTEAAKTGFTSLVSIQPCGQAKATASLKMIPLENLGVNNPSLPVLVTDHNIEAAIEKYPFFVLMGFADWCGYCQMMNSTVLNLSKELQGEVAFGLIDAEKNNATTDKYDIVSYPKILIFRNGTLISTQSGYKSTSELNGILEGLEPSLKESRTNRTSITIPAVARQRQTSLVEMGENETSGNDAALKLLDEVIGAAGINNTKGNTINIIIVNINNVNLNNIAGNHHFITGTTGENMTLNRTVV